MFDSLLSSVISVDGDLETIHFYTIDKGAKNEYSHGVEIYKAKAFDGEFYEMLKKIVKLHKEKSEGNNRVGLILPDNVFFTDTVKIPVIQKKAMTSSIGVAVSAIYKNSNELKYKTRLLLQNKQAATYGIIGVKKEILNKTISAIESEGFNVLESTFAASAMIRGAIALNSKLKNATYILVDVKENFTRFAFVIAGKEVGFYSLPFGFSTFKEDVIVNELSLFDHLPADLLVLNAKEKAKKKQLTTLDVDEDENEGDNLPQETDEDEDEEQTVETENSVQKTTSIFKRLNRKLPKFMIRPEPESAEGFVYENFRPIIKWTLELLRNNPELCLAATPKNVYVNMPERYSFIFDKIKEEGDIGAEFLPLFNTEIKEDVARNLELFGGFYLKKFNKQNNM